MNNQSAFDAREQFNFSCWFKINEYKHFLKVLRCSLGGGGGEGGGGGNSSVVRAPDS